MKKGREKDCGDLKIEMIPIDHLTTLWIDYDLLNRTPSMNDTVQMSHSTIDVPELPMR
jgi:hypothetical protein